MNASARLLLDRGYVGVEVATRGRDRLRHRPATPTPDLSARLRMHEAAILALLWNGYAPEPAGESEGARILGGRLGIADDLGMPTHGGTPAWLIAVGESMRQSDDSAVAIDSRL